MVLIENNDIGGFDSYISIICGEHLIRVLMNMVRQSKLEFVKYEQSEKIVSETESSVSYGSVVTSLVNTYACK